MKGGIIVEETFIDVADGDIVENIAVRKIRPNPFQPRRIFNEEALEELSQSIKEHGILQPIILRKTGNFYEIVAGERRFRATKKALIPEIPAVVRNYNDREMMELATLENLQREDLTPIEEAESYRKLMDALNMTQEVLAERLGKSRSYIANHVRLLTLPEDIQKMVDRGELSMGHGRALIGIKRKNIIPIVAKKVVDQQMNVRQLESYVHALNKDVSRVTKKKSVKNLYLDEAAAELRDHLGTSVSIKSSKNKGKIEIDFFSDEDLERIINLLKERGEERVILLGSLINGALILLGGFIGRLLQNIPDRVKETVMLVIALAIVVLGVQMGIQSDNFIIVMVSLVFGTIVGELIDIDGMLNRLGQWMEGKLDGGKLSNKEANKGSLAQGFVTGTLIFVIGSMSIIGALDGGLRNDHSVLITKGIIDGFTAMILASTMGVGVLIAAIPTVLYEGLIAIFAGFISAFIPQEALDLFLKQLTATGGIMIAAIGLNMLGLTKIRVANTLPAIPVVAIIVAIMYVL